MKKRENRLFYIFCKESRCLKNHKVSYSFIKSLNNFIKLLPKQTIPPEKFCFPLNFSKSNE